MKNFKVTNLGSHIENGELFLTENLAGTNVGICDAENVHYKFGKYQDGKLVQLATRWQDDEDQFEYKTIGKVLDIEKVWHMDNNYKSKPDPAPDHIRGFKKGEYVFFSPPNGMRFAIEANAFADGGNEIKDLKLDPERLFNLNGFASDSMSFVGLIGGTPAFKLDPKGDVILFVAGFWDAIPKNSLDKLREVSKPKEVVISEKTYEDGTRTVDKYTLPEFIWTDVRNQKGTLLTLFYYK